MYFAVNFDRLIAIMKERIPETRIVVRIMKRFERVRGWRI